MDIESALRNIGDWISKETELRKYPKGELLELSESLQALKSAIARQSVESEEVQEAIEQMEDALSPRYLESDGEWTGYNEFSTSAIRTAIAAPQAYQTWIPVSERLPEGKDAPANNKVMVLFDNGFVDIWNYLLLVYHITSGAEFGLANITHWMPLPKPPERRMSDEDSLRQMPKS